MKKGKNQKSAEEIKKLNPAKQEWYRNSSQLTNVMVLLIITYICYTPALSKKKEFVKWDDPEYVMEQPLIKSLAVENIKTLFKPTTAVVANYHPLTMVSLALNYHFSELDTKAYVQTNIFIHLMNTFLVFIFLFLLSRKKIWVGALGALWFGIHPMHVESVAWISERKDVLYCFFFLLSCIFYLRYLETKKWIQLVIVFFFFVCSCLSKAMAVPLPLVLLLIDFYWLRRINFKTVAEKIPFFLFAIWIGYNAVITQAQSAIDEYEIFTTFDHLIFASYGFVMYWVKLFFPLNLSALYAYPLFDQNKQLPFVYYLLPLVALAVVLFPLAIIYKQKNPEKIRTFVFGIGFFILMVALVLQFISVGIAIMADRYTYLPYIGAFFIIGMFVHNRLEDKKTKMLTATICTAFSIFFMVSCYNRVKVWNNTETLWTNVIEQYITSEPRSISNAQRLGLQIALRARGDYYFERNMTDKAFDDYIILTSVHTKDAGVYSNMGKIYAGRKDYMKSLEMYSEAINRDSTKFAWFVNHGFISFLLEKNEDAKKDFEKVILLCTDTLRKNSLNSDAIYYRALAFSNTGKTDEAISDFEKCVSLKPDFGDAWYNLSVEYKRTENFKAALEAAQKAKGFNHPVTESYLDELRARAE